MRKLRLNGKAGKVWQGSSRGFSMLEVVIAIALLGIIAVAVLSALSTASLALVINDRRATAESIARSQMESIKEDEYIDYSDPEHLDYCLIPVDDQGYVIQLIIEELVADPEQTGLQKVKVIVTYNIIGAENEQIERQFVLEGYKRE